MISLQKIEALQKLLLQGKMALESLQSKAVAAEEAMNLSCLRFMSEHLLKRIKPLRIVYLKSGLQGLCLSEGKH